MASFAVQNTMYTMFSNQRLDKAGGITNGDFPGHIVSVSELGDGYQSVAGQVDPKQRSKYSNIKEGLETSLSLEAKNRINRILAEAQQLSDVEKLLLYIKLPSGALSDDSHRQTPPSCLQASNRTEQAQAFTWIRSHLEEDNEICLPKQEVYDDYRSYCDSHLLKALCTADFGKVMKCVFPNIKPRRLGQRGQSRYCYGGLRKKLDITPPSLPDLEVQNKKVENETKEDDEVYTASCQLVCEWAKKLLGQNFGTIRELAEHLVANVYVTSKSVAAFTIIAAMQEAGIHNSKVSALFNASSAGDKHRETQLQLQRKLQEREQLKELKRKLQQQKDENEHQLRTSSSLECKTPATRPSSTRECRTPAATPSSTLESRSTSSVECKTPRVPSPIPSPMPLQSPNKYHVSKTAADGTQGYAQPRAKQGLKLMEILHRPESNPHCITADVQMGEITHNLNRVVTVTAVTTGDGRAEWLLSAADETEKRRRSSASDFEMDLDETGKDTAKEVEYKDVFVTELPGHSGGTNIAQSFVSIGTSENCLSDGVETIKEENILNDADAIGNEEQLQNLSLATPTECSSSTDVSDVSLNQSYGFSLSSSSSNVTNSSNNGSSNNSNSSSSNSSSSALFVNQSNNIPSRSAFVPFSQVQPRKELLNVQVSQSVTAPIPVIIPSSIASSSTSHSSISGVYTLEAVHQNTSQKATPTQSTVSVLPIPKSLPQDSASLELNCSTSQSREGIITILPIAQTTSASATTTDVIRSPSSAPAPRVAVNYSLPVSVSGVYAKTATSPGVGSTVVSVTASPSVVTTSQVSAVSRPAKSRFAPIRPKASPVKSGAPTVKEQKGNGADNPANDKRPVAAILKEKRAREAHAEALAKLQNNIVMSNLQTVAGMPFQSNLSLNNKKQLGNLTGIPVQSACGKEVVIIVNNSVSSGPNVSISSVLTPIKNQIPSLSSNTTVMENTGKKAFVQTSNNNLLANLELSGLMDTSEYQPSEDMTFSEFSPDMYTDQLHEIDETPVKIVKLNVTSPFRPDSACSLGRETPIKVKMGDTVLSRPESACSVGRETPSGGRKRKSSDVSQRRYYKRLNSTGEAEEVEELVDLEELGVIQVGDEWEADKQLRTRRAQSCTFDTAEKDVPKHKAFFVKTDALQSPDITSLEREALIEAFPYTSIIPHKSSLSQRSSVGVSARSLRNNSQQRLLNQQQVLDQRVKNFLHKEGALDESIRQVSEQTSNMVQRGEISEAAHNTQAVDRVCENLKASRTGQVGPENELNQNKASRAFDNNELPSDVADFIAEVLEKRHNFNQSAMSEPEMSSMSHCRQLRFSEAMTDRRHVSFSDDTETAALMDTSDKPTPSTSLPSESCLPYLGFDLGTEVGSQSKISKEFLASNASPSKPKDSDNLFTVPKAPPANSRFSSSKCTTAADAIIIDATSIQQRCSSLPCFTVRSPVQKQRQSTHQQRALSMSPNVHPNSSPERDILSPVSNIISPLGRIEVRENHPISVHIHGGSIRGKEDGLFVRPSSLPVKSVGGEESHRAFSTPYLASIQHSLQKPGEMVEFSNTQLVSSSPVTRNQLSRESSAERIGVQSTTPFSDPGYHSIGGSPIMNSTPVSSSTEGDSGISTGSGGGLDQLSFSVVDPALQSAHASVPLTQSAISMTHFTDILMSPDAAQPGGATVTQGQAHTNSSMFIPIQGSNNEIRYVTPIRPTVTVANTPQLCSQVMITSQKQSKTITASSPSTKSLDPPSYESAIRSLRQPSVVTSQRINATDTHGGTVEPMQIVTHTAHVQPTQSSPQKCSSRGSLLADMGSTSGEALPPPGSLPDSLPFSFKLAQLSRQTVDQSSTHKPPVSTANSAILAALRVKTMKERTGGVLLDGTAPSSHLANENKGESHSTASSHAPHMPLSPDDPLDLCTSADQDNKSCIRSPSLVSVSGSEMDTSTGSHVGLQKDSVRMVNTGKDLRASQSSVPLQQSSQKLVRLYSVPGQVNNNSHTISESGLPGNYLVTRNNNFVLTENSFTLEGKSSISESSPSLSSPEFQTFLEQESMDFGQVMNVRDPNFGSRDHDLNVRDPNFGSRDHDLNVRDPNFGSRDHELNEEELLKTWADLQEIEGTDTNHSMSGLI